MKTYRAPPPSPLSKDQCLALAFSALAFIAASLAALS